jgi:hypothetical protein
VVQALLAAEADVNAQQNDRYGGTVGYYRSWPSASVDSGFAVRPNPGKPQAPPMRGSTASQGHGDRDGEAIGLSDEYTPATSVPESSLLPLHQVP